MILCAKRMSDISYGSWREKVEMIDMLFEVGGRKTQSMLTFLTIKWG